MKCVICGTELNEKNKSEEHIIHNAIGGTLVSNKIYCKECNQKYGSNEDKAFVKIFAPILSGLKMHRNRKTSGTPYTGTLCDKEGNLYTATFKSGRVVKVVKNDTSEYVKYNENDFEKLCYHFEFNNDAFKKGLLKIAFNYAIYCGIDVSFLDKIFDWSKKEFVDKAVIIPFFPITVFDWVMEMTSVEKLFHAVRIFNCFNRLYAYVELFNTFQYYVVLSEKYEYETLKDIDKSYGNIIELNETGDANLLEELTPFDYKDADIICSQYQIDAKKLVDNLKKYHNYDQKNLSEQTQMLFKSIGKRAYENIRKQSYIEDYTKLVNKNYDRTDFRKIMSWFDNIETVSSFYRQFEFYTVYNQDCVNIKRYKRVLDDGCDYPQWIYENMVHIKVILSSYGYMKFHMIERRSED